MLLCQGGHQSAACCHSSVADQQGRHNLVAEGVGLHNLVAEGVGLHILAVEGENNHIPVGVVLHHTAVAQVEACIPFAEVVHILAVGHHTLGVDNPVEVRERNLAADLMIAGTQQFKGPGHNGFPFYDLIQA